MTDILERIEAEREARAADPMRPANPLLREAADEIKHLRRGLEESDAELEKFGHISYAQFEKELATMKAFAKQLSNALLKIRPLGGSEMFVKRGGDYYADPDYCGRLIEEMRADLHNEIKGRIRAEKGLSLSQASRQTHD